MKNSRIYSLAIVFFIINIHLSAQNNCILFASDFLTSNNADHTLTLKNAIQQAFEEGCTLIIDSPNKNTTESWVIKEVFIEGEKFNQISGVEIVFEAPVAAQSNFFKFENGLRDAPPSMFVFEECDNFSIKGKGKAIISMNGIENQTGHDHYIRTSEWYHCFKMLSCNNVTMEGLIIDGAGGDGIVIDSKRYDGAQRLCNVSGHHPINFTIRNCFINKAWRNGIAIGSGENILIEECTISKTKGTAPQAGIDIEIESCGAILKNLVVKNNTLIDNGAYGVECSFSTVMPSNNLNIKFEGNEMIGGKGFAIDTRNKNYIAGNIDISGGTIDITQKDQVAPFGLLLSCPKPSQKGNDLVYNLGDDMVICNSAGNNFFTALRVNAREVNLFGCEENVAVPCRQIWETNWNFFGDVYAEKMFIWDNHERGQRLEKAVQISRGGRSCMNPTGIKIHAIKRNFNCECGGRFNLGTSYNNEDNCDVCASGSENRDQSCDVENDSITSRIYDTQSEVCDVDVKIEVLKTQAKDLPEVAITNQKLSVDKDGFLTITVCRSRVGDYPLAAKLEWNKGFEFLRHYFYQYPKFIRIPAGKICATRKIKVREEIEVEDLKDVNLKLEFTKFYNPSTRILEFDKTVSNFNNNVPSNQDTTHTTLPDTINLSNVCVPNGITFKTQFELDSFRILYPNCTEIEGIVKIKYSIENPITHFYGLNNVKKMGGLNLNYGVYKNLNGLENLEEIKGILSIHNADSLSNLKGFTGLKKIGSFLANDLNINNLEGLESLQIIDRNFQIYDNDALKSLEGLSSLQEIGFEKQTDAFNNIFIGRNPKLESIQILENISNGHFKGNIRIVNNPSLETLDGLQIINRADGLVEINQNESLVDLKGLDNLEQVNRLKISANKNLYSLQGLESLTTIEHGLEIHNNAILYDLEGISNLNQVGFIKKQSELPFIKISSNERLTSFLPLKNLEFNNQFFNGILTLRDNPSVLNLLGFEQLKGVYVLEITNLGISDFKELNQLWHIPNLLTIKNNYSLLSLHGLENLTDIGDETKRAFKTLVIEGNARLKSLEPLRNLRSDGMLFYGSLLIIENDSLQNLHGLEGIDSIDWDLKIMGNENLKSLDGLESLHYVKSNKTISKNPKLQNIDALSNFKETYPKRTTFFEISDNPVLENINGLRNFKFSQIAALHFFNNPLIDICDYPELCQYIARDLPERWYDIFGNGEECEFIDDIRNGCDQSPSSLQNTDNQLNINIYPNPTDGKIYLQGDNLLNAKVSVSDVTGRLILIEKLNGTNEVQLPEKVTGLLLLKIETEEGVAVKRVFKN